MTLILNLILLLYVISSSSLYYLIPYSFTLPIPQSIFINFTIMMLLAPISSPLWVTGLFILFKIINREKYKIGKGEINFIIFLFIFSIVYYIFIFDKLLPLPFKMIENIFSKFR
jgi:hypothetical protein